MGSGLEGSSPVLFPLCEDIGQRTTPSLDFFPYWLYSLSPLFCREATWSLVGRVFPWWLSLPMRRWGRVLRDYPYSDIGTLILTIVQDSLPRHKSPYSNPKLTSSCLCHWVDVSFLTPNMGSLASEWSSSPASYESFGGEDCQGGKRLQVPNKDLYIFSILSLELYPTLVPILIVVWHPLRLHVNPIL